MYKDVYKDLIISTIVDNVANTGLAQSSIKT